jgi:hypothetical protein
MRNGFDRESNSRPQRTSEATGADVNFEHRSYHCATLTSHLQIEDVLHFRVKFPGLRKYCDVISSCLIPTLLHLVTRDKTDRSCDRLTVKYKLKIKHPYCKHKWPPGQGSLIKLSHIISCHSRVEFGKVFSTTSLS